MKRPEPIFTIHLMPAIDRKLIALLKTISKEDWSRQTISPKWKVKDVAVHLLDGNLRTLSMLRDNYFEETPEHIASYADLVRFLNALNTDWIKAMKRLSPTVIINLLDRSGKEYCDFLQTLPPFDKAAFSVAWAGEQESANWFHIAREYTEKWHHQQQIRLAVGAEDDLLSEDFYLPYLDTSMRALPYHYRGIKGHDNDLIRLVVRGESDKLWYLKWQENGWELFFENKQPPTCEVIIKDEFAWRIFTKGIDKQVAIKQAKITGNQALGMPIFDMITVMA